MARIDMVTCSQLCRTRLCRQRKMARNALVTPSGSKAARLGSGRSNEPLRSPDGIQDALGDAGQLGLWLPGEDGR
jgi:hypothetical protein